MTLRRILLGLALALVAGLAGVEAAATSSRPTADTKAPKPLKLRETCVRRADRATVVRFRAGDGVRLLGVMLGRGPAAVVLAHESGTATLCSWLPYGRTLARRGYRVLVFDARGHGSSSASRSPSRRFRVDLDAAAAAREMRRRGARSVVLAGGSFGAMASIAAGGSVRPSVDGVVPVSPGVTFRGLDAEAAARRLNVPTLFVVAEEDAGFPEAARTLYAATATQDKRLLVVPGFGHGSDLLALSAEARAAVDRFIDDHSRRTLRLRALAAGAEDIRLLVRELEATHPNPYHSVSREAFHRAAEDLVARMPQLDDDQVLVELMRLLVLGDRDGHTGLYPGGHRRALHRYPLRLYDFADGLHVVRALGVPGAVGAKLVAIAGVPLADVEAKVRPLVPGDNEWSRRGVMPGFLVTAEVLHGLRIIPSTGPTTFTLELRTGERRDVTLAPITAQRYDARLGPFFQSAVRPGVPRKRLPASLRYPDRVRYITTIDRGRAVYFAYNNTTQPTDELTERLERLVRSRKVKRVIIDVRRNGGGNNRTYVPLMYYLRSRSVNRPGKLVVLIGRTTFSAAQNFINELERATRVTFVGEPSGGSPNHFSNGTPIELPTLGLLARTSRGYYQDSRPDDPRLATEPHVGVDVTSADFMAGRDPVLRAALRVRR